MCKVRNIRKAAAKGARSALRHKFARGTPSSGIITHLAGLSLGFEEAACLSVDGLAILPAPHSDSAM
jgi:hypothetical protein